MGDLGTIRSTYQFMSATLRSHKTTLMNELVRPQSRTERRR